MSGFEQVHRANGFGALNLVKIPYFAHIKRTGGVQLEPQGKEGPVNW